MNVNKKMVYLFVVVFSISVAKGQDTDYMLEQQLPVWFYDFYKAGKIDSSYKIAGYINPFYIDADFNGDSKTDIAVLIEESKTKKKGILICHGITKKFFVIGAGKDFGNGGDDFSWMDIWKLYRETKVKLTHLKGQAIWVEKSESAGAVIYWTGQGYKWHQQGD